MQILFVTPGFPPFTGGGERYARSLALALTGRGHTVTILTSTATNEQAFWRGTADSDARREEKEGALRVIRRPVQSWPGGRTGLLAWRKAMVLLSMLPGDQSRPLLWMSRRIPPLVGFDDALAQLPELPDVVNGFNLSWEHALVTGWQFARCNGIPFVVTPFAHFGEEKRARVALNSTMDHQRRILTDADAVLTLTKVEIEGLRHWNIKPRRVAIVGAGVDAQPVATNTKNVLRRHRVRKPFAVYIGRINYDKGAVHAATAVASLLKQHASLTLALVGQVTPEFERFWQRLEPEAQAAILPLGVLDEADKHALLQEATMLLLPSRADSFGIVLLEAWLHGTPVVAARAGGIPGVVDEGENGLLVPFGDIEALAQAIRRLLEDEPLRRRIGEQGREKVRTQYTWEQVCDRVLDVYHHVLADQNRPERV